MLSGVCDRHTFLASWSAVAVTAAQISVMWTVLLIMAHCGMPQSDLTVETCSQASDCMKQTAYEEDDDRKHDDFGSDPKISTVSRNILMA